MDELYKQRFDAHLLEWARNVFAEELQSDFCRARAFDSPRTSRQLTALRKQPTEQMQILARVLPLQVFGNTPDRQERRSRLLPVERAAVEKLMADYDDADNECWTASVEAIARAGTKHAKAQFVEAAARGSVVASEIASRWKCELATAGRGEWGFIFNRSWGRFVVSIVLGRLRVVGYTLSMFDAALHSIRFNDHYLGVLGIGAGAWVVDSAAACEKKVLKAADFAYWHLQEYDKIVTEVLRDANGEVQ